MKSNEDDCTQATDDEFWLKTGQPSLNLIWDNPEDDVYAGLLDR